ncbi:hypothetical protein KEM55_003025, partial [Ascosphaera atra]
SAPASEYVLTYGPVRGPAQLRPRLRQPPNINSEALSPHLGKRTSNLEQADSYQGSQAEGVGPLKAWKRLPIKSPEQHNDYNCGMFVCACMHLAALGQPLDVDEELEFPWEDIPAFHRHVARELHFWPLVGADYSQLDRHQLRE